MISIQNINLFERFTSIHSEVITSLMLLALLQYLVTLFDINGWCNVTVLEME